MKEPLSFHPAVARWFGQMFAAPTPAQAEAWPAIQAGSHVLIAAPTGSGKTLAAFLAAIDSLVRQGLDSGLPDETQVVYVSPLKALSNDIERNLAAPLAGISTELSKLGLPEVEIRTWVRTGDTPAGERSKMARRPPHIVVTTPESFYLLLGSDSGRAMLKTTRTVIVDEIHALAPSKRGSHLALSLERLAALCPHPVVRIGLSATQKPIGDVARLLVGAGGPLSPSPSGYPPREPCHNGPEGDGERVGVRGSGGLQAINGESERRSGSAHSRKPLVERLSPEAAPHPSPLPASGERGSHPAPQCRIIDRGHKRKRDLAIEVPSSPLEAVMSADVWGEVYDRLGELAGEHRTTLVFANTRRLVERVTRHLAERIGEDKIAAHHGSLSKERRLDAERRLKAGKLKVLVATASLELGIDIGEVDLVCQLGSPRAISTFLQRVGRSSHAVDGTPKGRLFPLSRDDLVDCTALIDATQRGELDRIIFPEQPLDVLAQQIVAEVAVQEWKEDELFVLVRRAWPYRELKRPEFDEVVAMLADGFTTRRGRRGALIHRDAVNGILRGRRGARLTALTSGGTIPDLADYQVLLEPQSLVVGSVNEDFAVESAAGDVFQLGNTAYRILRVERGVVRVEDAQGAPPTIPFWLGEAPGRSDELSAAVSHLRGALATRLADDPAGGTARLWLGRELGMAEAPALQLVEYLAAAQGALGCLPTQKTIVLERFFDEAGGMQLVVHSPFGSRINRAWGLALRKRFCRKFNFELQAAATEDCIVLSLTTAHSFELAEVTRYLHSNSVREVLIQAMLDAPMFITRWRWVAAVSLALPRFRGGKKVPALLARMQAEDLIGSVFPDQIACAENLTGEREVPDHPLVKQAISDCLNEAMDLPGLMRLLQGLETGAILVVARDLNQPSPLAHEVLNARPYAFLDDAPLEERRTQAVMSRRWLDPATASDLGRLDAEAIARVKEEAWPEAVNADELHDALVWLGFIAEDEVAREAGWQDWLRELAVQNRAARMVIPGGAIWIAAERVPQLAALWPDAALEPDIKAPAALAGRTWSCEEALVEIVRGRLEGLGPVTEAALARSIGVEPAEMAAALVALQTEGFAMRGRFTPGATDAEWCERGLLARINRYTVKRLRAEIEPVSSQDFLRFLLTWQHVDAEARMEGPLALHEVVEQLEGFEAPAAAWEKEILGVRLSGYQSGWLDDACRSGRTTWVRLRNGNGRANGAPRRAGPIKSTPIALLLRRNVAAWRAMAERDAPPAVTGHADTVASFIGQHGASFFHDIVAGTGLLRSQVEDALAELSAHGMVSSDSFGGLRALLVPSAERKPFGGARRRGRTAAYGMDDAGRWAFVPPAQPAGGTSGSAGPTHVEHIARTLLRRYGVVLWRLLEREAARLPPWRDLLRVYRTLESRGEIRGGRFVAGIPGEQYALPEAVGLLRETRRQRPRGSLVSISAADPLNLVGILTPGPRLPALTGNRLLFEDGLPVATLAGGEMQLLVDRSPAEEWQLRLALLGRTPRADRQAAQAAPRPGGKRAGASGPARLH
jgi:ATP-dependent helicase Lhr and Lhr-like helicase